MDTSGILTQISSSCKMAPTKDRAIRQISGSEVFSAFQEKTLFSRCKIFPRRCIQPDLKILVLWWQLLPKQLLKRSAKPIRIPVTNQKPFWAKVPPGPTHFPNNGWPRRPLLQPRACVSPEAWMSVWLFPASAYRTTEGQLGYKDLLQIHQRISLYPMGFLTFCHRQDTPLQMLSSFTCNLPYSMEQYGGVQN